MPHQAPDLVTAFLDPEQPFHYGLPEGITDGDWRELLRRMQDRFEFFPWRSLKSELFEYVGMTFLMIDDDLSDEEQFALEEHNLRAGSRRGEIVEVDLADAASAPVPRRQRRPRASIRFGAATHR